MNILVIQNRMGIGDKVIFLPFVEAISKKYNTSVIINSLKDFIPEYSPDISLDKIKINKSSIVK